MAYIFEGDPRIFVDAAGADMVFFGGQPVMDLGLENAAVLSLFSRQKWPGNAILSNPAEKIGSTFEEVSKQSITVSSLNKISSAARLALQWMIDTNVASAVEAVTRNPSGFQIETEIKITAPGNDLTTILVTKNGANWLAQKLLPAHLRKDGPTVVQRVSELNDTWGSSPWGTFIWP